MLNTALTHRECSLYGNHQYSYCCCCISPNTFAPSSQAEVWFLPSAASPGPAPASVAPRSFSPCSSHGWVQFLISCSKQSTHKIGKSSDKISSQPEQEKCRKSALKIKLLCQPSHNYPLARLLVGWEERKGILYIY